MADLPPIGAPTRRVMSPCIGICMIDRKGTSGLCLGCKRSIPEIGRWQSLDDVERQKIIDDLPKRKF